MNLKYTEPCCVATIWCNLIRVNLDGDRAGETNEGCLVGNHIRPHAHASPDCLNIASD